MIQFEGATFTIGSTFGEANERPPTAVGVVAFLLDRDLVTAGSYARCVEASACTTVPPGEGCNGADPARTLHPANCVTMQQAATYCAWLGRRLPTEIEYEWAAAGKESRLYPWGFTPVDDTRACFGHCKDGRRTCEVGKLPAGATPEGVLDLAGNVWEWTSSPACPYGSPECGSAQRITRGGGYCGADPKLLRTHTREPRDPSDGTSTVGFRCARTM
ncbi:MAG: SUMF1/EgtB/PvdO family nonheme iron enzyme [Myxococcales bacterium]|nr:SUMF1/EgtB/PvdO family nonheme iron enzyme [Myxococcales bacterium]